MEPTILWKLTTECLAFIKSLVNQKSGFKFHVSSGGFTCTFDLNGAVPTTTVRTPAASLRRKRKLKCNINIETERQQNRKTEEKIDQQILNRTPKTSRQPPMTY